MRIKTVRITNLFGIFDHTIPLNLIEHATIIIGPNGFGKTTLLQMVYDLFAGEYSIFYRVPFSKLTVELESGGFINIDKSYPKKLLGKSIPFDISMSYSRDGEKTKKLNLQKTSKNDPRQSFNTLLKYYDDFEDKKDLRNRIRHHDEPQLSSSEIEEWLKLFDHRDSYEGINPLKQKDSEYLKFRRFLKGMNVYLIQAQRLTSRIKSNKKGFRDKNLAAVNIYSDELVKIIAKKLAKSTEIAQKLDSTFPNRVISQKPPSNVKEVYINLLEELKKLNERRIHLKETGILVELDDEFISPEGIDNEVQLQYINGVLTEYVSDTQEKLAVFDDLSDKIELLKRIINERFFPHKKLEINKDKGFIFITSNGHELAPNDLSSGEQHELVLLYELLFKVPTGSLVLIDEPELSLHIAWQQKILTDLLDITKIAKLDVLIATHAPDIIHKHWHLTVDLGESKGV